MEVKETKERLGKVEMEVKETKERLGKVELEVKETKLDVNKVKMDVKSVKLLIENEIKVNIRRVAEGPLDLSRNIRNIMDAKTEMEGLAVRVNMLESEVREQRRKLVTV